MSLYSILEASGIEIDKAVCIEISDDEIVARMSGRRTCTSCSTSFHIKHNPPKTADVCDQCGGELAVRKDDAPETVVARLKVYHQETEPLKNFYQAKGNLCIVESMGDINDITNLIIKALER